LNDIVRERTEKLESQALQIEQLKAENTVLEGKLALAEKNETSFNEDIKSLQDKLEVAERWKFF
jgi:hypothetical protein